MKLTLAHTIGYWIFFIPLNFYAQLNSVVIIPANPTETDIVSVIASTTDGSGDCDLESTAISNPTSSQMNVEVCHEKGPLAYICSSIDTIELGVLPAGTYTVTYSIRRENLITPVGCSGENILDTKDIVFTVSTTSGIALNDIIKNSVKLYPNPASTNISIEYELYKTTPTAEFVIYNMAGQAVKTIPIINRKGLVKEDISSLQRGSYFYRIEAPEYTTITHKLTITN